MFIFQCSNKFRNLKSFQQVTLQVIAYRIDHMVTKNKVSGATFFSPHLLSLPNYTFTEV